MSTIPQSNYFGRRPVAKRPTRVGIRWSRRVVPASHGHNACGWIPIARKRLTLPYESHLENRVISFLARRQGLVVIQTQPFTLRCVVEGRAVVYTPDVLVVFDPVPRALRWLGFGRWTVVEVKPAAIAIAESESIEFRLALVNRVLGLPAICMTERELEVSSRRARS